MKTEAIPNTGAAGHLFFRQKSTSDETCRTDSQSPTPEIRAFADEPIFDVEKRLILAALAHHGGKKCRAAASLGISKKTLYNRLAEYGRAGR